MSQYQYGDVNPIVAPVSTAQSTTIGDLVGLNLLSGTIYKASEQVWDTNLATTQANFVSSGKYVGICAQSKFAGSGRVFGNSDNNAIRCDTSGVFEFDCASASFNVGDFVGPAKDSGNALLNQTVVAVADVTKAIGVVVEGGTSLTKVKVRVLSQSVPLSR